MTLVGDWDSLEEFLWDFEQDLEEAGQLIIKELAESVAADVKGGIISQSFSWVPLSPKYVGYKEQKGLDQRILVATGVYVENIGVYQDGDSWYAGVPDISVDKGFSLGTLAAALEYGTERMPARPHWSIVFSTLSKRVRDICNKYGLTYRELY